jgi:type IV secretory pathway VirB4 component
MADISNATQEFVPVKSVRDSVLIMKSGNLRAVLMASALNFGLKSEEEQRAILMQFQSFLNSLDFSVQFFIQSREMDIRPYIALLKEREKEQMNDLLEVQTREYIKFVQKFVEETDIMTKRFFIVVPYTPPLLESASGGVATIKQFFGFGEETQEMTDKEEEQFEESLTQLEQRVSVVEQGLQSTGVETVQLGNEELIELLYKLFNPSELETPMQRGEA